MSGRPKEYDEDEVIRAAIDVFWTNGYEASSTQELCKKTNLGRGSLYHAFGNKKKLYQLALCSYQETGFEMQKQILNGSGSVKEKLKSLMQWGVNLDLDSGTRRSCMALHSIMERSSKDKKIDQINHHYVHKLEEIIYKVIKEGQKNNEISNDKDTLKITRAFLASYYGIRVLGQSSPNRDFLSDVIEGVIDSL